MFKILGKVAKYSLISVSATAVLYGAHIVGITEFFKYKHMTFLASVREESYVEAQLQGEKIPPKYRNDVVSIQMQSGRGSGVTLAPGVVLTARHVVFARKYLLVSRPSSFYVKYYIKSVSSNSDLALIVDDRSREIGPEILEQISQFNSREGSRITSIGYGGSSRLMMNKGIVGPKSPFINSKHNEVSSSPFIGGMSGGPVYNARMKISGIISASYSIADYLSTSEANKYKQVLSDHMAGKYVSPNKLYVSFLVHYPAISVNAKTIRIFLNEVIEEYKEIEGVDVQAK